MNIKNNQKGFVVQGVIALVALVLIGGGAYYVSTTRTEVNEHKITSISKTSGSIGDTIVIEGYNILDARGDQNIVIKNSQGDIGYLGFGNPEHINVEKKNVKMSFTLEKEVCRDPATDKGGPCMAGSVSIIPGEYSIYVKSALANFESNKVKFTVVENSNSISTSNWKTYSTNKYGGFEFKYPNDWSIKESAFEGEIVGVVPPNNPIEYTVNRFSVGVFASAQGDTSSLNLACKDQSWKAESSDFKWSMLKCLEEKKYIGLYATNQEVKQTLEKILSTYKFTSSTSKPVTQSLSIQVISPKSGDKLVIGKTYDVRWSNYSGQENLNIVLVGKKSSTVITTTLKAVNVGTYKMTVPSVDTNDTYKIEVYPAGGRELVGRSGEFTITNTSQPSITVISPNGGEKISYGSIYMGGDLNFTWKSSNLNYKPTPKFTAFLINENNVVVRADYVKYFNPVENKAFTTSFAGADNVSINSKYKIKVCDEVEFEKITCDESDNYFTITN